MSDDIARFAATIMPDKIAYALMMSPRRRRRDMAAAAGREDQRYPMTPFRRSSLTVEHRLARAFDTGSIPVCGNPLFRHCVTVARTSREDVGMSSTLIGGAFE